MNPLLPDPQPTLEHAEPVLCVTSVADTIKYWQHALGFPNQWVWGDPPTHGGVSWNGVAGIQFSQNAERAKASAGNWVWIRVKYIDELYKLHQRLKADIDEPLTKRDWGMDEYVIKDNNGYYIVFSGNSAVREKSGSLPDSVIVVERKPTNEEFIALHHSVGWTGSINLDHLDNHLSAPTFSIVAIDTKTNDMIGCAMVISDNSSFYYIKDVMVKKEWQKMRVGTALMTTISKWLDKNGIKKSLVGLYTGENLEPFYAQFGFSKAFGMVKRM